MTDTIKLAAYLWIGPTEAPEAIDEDSPLIGVQRLFVTPEYANTAFGNNLAISDLAQKLGIAVFGITGDDDLFHTVESMVRMRCNVSVKLNDSMTASVYPAFPDGGNIVDGYAIDFHTDTHRED